MSQVGKPLRIAFLSDTHFVEADDFNYKQWQMALEKAKSTDPDIYLVGGDITNSGSKKEAELFFASIKDINKPVLFVPGNHDIGNKVFEGVEGMITSERIAYYRENFGPDFYAENHHGYQFIMLNSQLFQSGLPEEKEQMSFLKKQLEVEGPKIILIHNPLFLNCVDEPGGNYWNAEPEVRKEILDLLAGKGVVAVLSGHMHKLIVNCTDILHLSCPPTSFGVPEIHLGQGFVVLDVTPSNIHFQLYHVESLYEKP